MEKKYLVVIYGCDYEKNGRGLGKESKARVRKALEYIEKQSVYPTAIVLAAGSPPNKNYLPLSFYMKKRLENYFFKKLFTSALYNAPNIIVAKEQCWGTFEETVFANSTAEYYEYSHVVAVSSWYHLYRIALIHNLIGGLKTIELIPSWRISNWFSPFLEFPKMFKVFLDYHKYKKILKISKKEKDSVKQ